ncbi:MAG TPA: ATP-binding protein [Candidatus Tectomicrobia bacterium]
MSVPLRVLILEDRPADAELMLYELRRVGFEPHWQRVETEADYVTHLHADLDVILADYSLGQFDALQALALLREHNFDIPCIVVTGAVSEEAAVECMKQGAADYLLKDRLARLGPAVTHALEQKRLRDDRQRAEAALRAKDEELQTMSQQLWQAAKLATMGELAASLAHELNNPLATVSLRLEALLARTPVDAPQRHALDVIVQEVERMATLVANLLEFSRRSQPEISSLDVREELDTALALIHYHLRNHRIVVMQEFAPEVPLIHADRQQLRQLFLNLLTNASDAMPQGGALTLRVAAGTTPTGRPVVRVEVSDTGCGIAPEHLPQVMEPFFTTKAEGKGTGLGLPICRRIVQEHRGTLELTSIVGQGTTVHLQLPITNGTYTQGLEYEADGS